MEWCVGPICLPAIVWLVLGAIGITAVFLQVGRRYRSGSGGADGDGDSWGGDSSDSGDGGGGDGGGGGD